MQELGFTPSHGVAHVFGSALYQLSEDKALPCAFAEPHDRVCIPVVLWSVWFSQFRLGSEL